MELLIPVSIIIFLFSYFIAYYVNENYISDKNYLCILPHALLQPKDGFRIMELLLLLLMIPALIGAMVLMVLYAVLNIRLWGSKKEEQDE